MEEETDTFGLVAFGFHSELPITVFCAAPGHAAHVERDWHPPEPLHVQLEPLPMGGSAVFTEGTGHLPNLTGRLNPILDDLDRMYLYATNVAIDEWQAATRSLQTESALAAYGCQRVRMDRAVR